MKIKLILSLILSLALLVFASPVSVYAIPTLPHAFYGIVEINNNPAPDGTEISATVDTGSIIEGIELQNPVTTVGDSYGYDSPRLLVQGNISSGATITFYVTNANGTAIGGTATFVAGGGPTLINLSVTIAPPPPPPSDEPSAPAPTIAASLFGGSASFRISSTGEVLQTITATSEDGTLTITIPAGTIALDINGQPLSDLTADVDLNPPDPPEGDSIIGLVFDFGPEGATFEPPITITWTYDPGEIPEGTELMVMVWDDEANEWVEFDGDYTINPDTGIVTISVSHFSMYAIIAQAAPVPTVVEVVPPEPEEEVEVAPPVEEEVEVAPPVEEEVVIAPPVEAAVPPPPAEKPVNWALFGGLIGAVVVVALLVYWIVIRRRTA